MDSKYKLELRGIDKSFPGVHALKEVSIQVRPGTVHSIVGENGAGKSTLMKIISGGLKPDKGTILLDGEEVTFRDQKAAKDRGIAMIYQELLYVPQLTIQENLAINNQPLVKGTPFIDWKRAGVLAKQALEKEGMKQDPKTLLSDMSVSDIQLLEIIKATEHNASLIIMDEPTSSLTQHETERLFAKIKRLRAEGKTILYISHKMEEIFQLSDYVTIMRDGCFIDTKPIAEVTREEIITMMVGRKIDTIYPPRSTAIGEPYFEVRNFTCGKLYHDISFYVRKGEIVGLAGLVGAGRTEIVRAVAGLDPHDCGEVYVDRKRVDCRNVEKAVRAGVMMATEDRRRYGLVPIRSIKENITLASLKCHCRLCSFVNLKEERETAQVYFDRMRVKANSMDVPTYTLSGGNQQKVVLAKWMTSHPRVFILDEPTRGIDVGAKHEIYNIMNEMSAEGMAIVMISSELPELLGMCDRIYVVCEGRIAGEVEKKDFSQERIMQYATGGK